MKSLLLAISIFAEVLLCSCSPRKFTSERNFLPAVYRAKSKGSELHGELQIFPMADAPVTISMGQGLAPSAFSNDGLSIFGAGRSANHGLAIVKLRLDIRSREFFLKLPVFTRVYSLSPKKDGTGLFVSGWYDFGGQPQCGLFDVQFQPAAVRRIRSESCDYSGSWELLSLSPRGNHAVGRSQGGIWDVDLETGAVKLLSDSWWPMYSPDGKWVAVGQRKHLLDHIRLTRLADGSDRDYGAFWSSKILAWSPDSKQVLVWSACLLNFGPALIGTLVELDVSNGKRQEVRGSDCANLGYGGWVSANLLPRMVK